MKGGVKEPAQSTGASNPLLNSTTPPPPLQMLITAPRICFRAPADPQTGLVSERAEDGTIHALVTFQYNMQVSNVVERNNYGAELAEVSSFTGNCNLLSGEEKLLASWSEESDVEQVIGVPFLSEIPVLKYLFSTTTTNRQKSWFFITARAVFAHPESLPQVWGGQLQAFDDIAPVTTAVSSN